MYKKITLSNKMRIISAPMKETKALTLYLVVKTGSRYEQKDQNGISHFLEHLFFKGTKKRPSTLDIAKELDSIGANYNAFTSEEMTGFYIQAESAKLPLSLDILFDILQNSLFDNKEIEREKGVISEEINMRNDTPMIYIFDLYKSLVYGDTALGREILGTQEVIKQLKRESFLDYKNKYYSPNQIVLASVGSINNKALDLIKKYSKRLKPGQVYDAETINDSQNKPELLLHYKNTDQAHMILGYKSIKRGSKMRYAQEVLNVIMGGSMSSRLFIELRERRGLCYQISSDAWYFNDTGSFLIYAGVKMSKIEDAIKLILNEFRRVREKGVKTDELQKAKDFLKGKMALRMESSYNRSSFLADQELLLNEIKTPEEEIKEIEKVSKNDIIKFAQEIMQPAKLNLAIIGPFKDKEKFEKYLGFKI